MSRIKSAWEIAMEKTADIQIDENRLKEEILVKEGMALAGSFLNNIDICLEEVAKKCDSFSKEDLPQIRKGLKQVVLSNLVLPLDDSYKFRFSRLAQLAVMLNSKTENIMNEIGAFFDQYLTAREEFVNRMKEQINQMIKENPNETSASQYSKLIEQNLQKMQNQYSQALESSVKTLEETL